MTVVSWVGQIRPFLGRGQFVALEVVLVPHQSIATDGEAKITSVGIMDRKVADLCRNLAHELLRRCVLFEQAVALENLKRVGRADPKNIAFWFGPSFPQVGDTLV